MKLFAYFDKTKFKIFHIHNGISKRQPHTELPKNKNSSRVRKRKPHFSKIKGNFISLDRLNSRGDWCFHSRAVCLLMITNFVNFLMSISFFSFYHSIFNAPRSALDGARAILSLSRPMEHSIAPVN